MKRIQHLMQNLSISAGPSRGSVTFGKFSAAAETSAPAIFGPMHYEPNYAYPLIVWLHGPNDGPGQLKRIMPLVSMRNYVAVAPCGTLSAPPSTGRRGFSWSQTEAHILAAEQRVFAAVATVQEHYHINPDRVFLAGFDCGGTMALRIACNHPDGFAGVLSLCGEFPLGQAPLSRLAEVRHLPIMFTSGRSSDEYPAEKVCENLRLLYAAGINSITLREYPCRQELTAQMLGDVDRWIMEQITAAKSVSVA